MKVRKYIFLLLSILVMTGCSSQHYAKISKKDIYWFDQSLIGEEIDLIISERVESQTYDASIDRWGIVGSGNRIQFSTGSNLKYALNKLLEGKYKRVNHLERVVPGSSTPYVKLKKIRPEFSSKHSRYKLALWVEVFDGKEVKSERINTFVISNQLDDVQLAGVLVAGDTFGDEISKLETTAIRRVLNNLIALLPHTEVIPEVFSSK
jgi:hypothetical protein